MPITINIRPKKTKRSWPSNTKTPPIIPTIRKWIEGTLILLKKKKCNKKTIRIVRRKIPIKYNLKPHSFYFSSRKYQDPFLIIGILLYWHVFYKLKVTRGIPPQR
jgi:hypothetical protein